MHFADETRHAYPPGGVKAWHIAGLNLEAIVRNTKPRRNLLAVAMLIGVVWLVVLPAIGRLPAVRDEIDRVDAAGINASALYWTELEDERLWRRGGFGQVDSANHKPMVDPAKEQP